VNPPGHCAVPGALARPWQLAVLVATLALGAAGIAYSRRRR
jgi:hypothetical protein